MPGVSEYESFNTYLGYNSFQSKEISDDEEEFTGKLQIGESQTLLEMRSDYIRSVYCGDTKSQRGICVETKEANAFENCETRLEKPLISYKSLIEMAIGSSPYKKMSVMEIQTWIEDNVPYYRSTDEIWKNFILYTLYIDSCFKRISENDTEVDEWTIINSEVMAEYRTWTRPETEGRSESHKRVLDFDECEKSGKKMKLDLDCNCVNSCGFNGCFESPLFYEDKTCNMELTPCEYGALEEVSTVEASKHDQTANNNFSPSQTDIYNLDFTSGINFFQNVDRIHPDGAVFKSGYSTEANNVCVKLDFSSDSDDIFSDSQSNFDSAYVSSEDSSDVFFS